MSTQTIWVQCKLCRKKQRYTFTPYSLSAPIMVCCACGRGKGTGGGFVDTTAPRRKGKPAAEDGQ